MKERPILFSAPMVRALLDGSKTQTRRVLKLGNGQYMPPSARADINGWRQMLRACPYGQPGDRLWVREAWKAHTTFDNLPPRDIPQSHVWYMADDGYKAESRFRQSMFMPRWASRITLEVAGVRVERLQDISEADAIAEGIEPFTDFQKSGHWLRYDKGTFNGYVSSPVESYASLWESINGSGSWDLNPWVWVVEFKRATP